MKLLLASISLSLILAPFPAWAEEVTLKLGKLSIRAEIADTAQSRNRGLMQRDHLCADCGMLFVFAQPGRYDFWMKNTPLPLSVAFIDADGSIINIEEMQPNTTTAHSAQGEALYALEMNSGWFARHSITPSERVLGLHHVPMAH